MSARETYFRYPRPEGKKQSAEQDGEANAKPKVRLTFISLQLAKRFVAADPPPALVNRMAHKLLKKDGDLREVMRTMLSSPEFWSEGAYRAKVTSTSDQVLNGAARETLDAMKICPIHPEEPLHTGQQRR